MSTTFNIENPKLTAKNGHFGNKYAPLDEVLRVVKEGLPKGAFVTQGVIVVDGVSLFRSTCHFGTAGKAVSVDIPFILGKQDPQGLGSAITYHRRYGLCLLFNLVGEEDDDGEAAQGRPKGKSTAKKSTSKRSTTKTKAKAEKPAAATKSPAPAEDDDDDW